MNRIVERCPSCGVEHDEPTHECEACGSPVRFWCRTHSREIGWLESDVCPRCPPSAARPRPPKPAPPSVAPTPAPSAGAAPASASRPYLRFESRPTAPAAPPATSPPAPATPVVPATPAPAPAAAETPPATEKVRPNRRGIGVRLFEALLTVLQTGIVGVLMGVAYGGIAAYRVGAEVPLEAAIGGVKGGMAGLALGVLIAAAFFRRSAHPRED